MATETQKGRQSAATRSQLVAVGRRLFAERGFAGTSTEEIVAAAGVTRGALYYHFASKEALFRAVVAEVEEGIHARVTAVAMAESDPWPGVIAGCAAFLDACLDPATQRIALLDAPSVLGLDAWREVGASDHFGLLVVGLEWAMVTGTIDDQPAVPLAHVLLGALNEGALYIARAEDQAGARRHVGQIVERLLRGLERPEGS